jgi:hypothetical protein
MSTLFIRRLQLFAILLFQNRMTILLKPTTPLDRLRQMRRVRNVTAFPELHNLPLALLFPDYRKRSVGKVHVAFRTSLEATCPPNHVYEAAFIAVYIRYAERIDEAVLEGRESHTKRGIERLVQPQ